MLTWKVLTVTRRGLTPDAPPGNEELEWVANSSTLICGERDAVLVDTFMTIDQSRTQIDWVAATGKNLVAIYLTHAHGDHTYGLGPLLERFPRARAVALPEVVQAMRTPTVVDTLRKAFPGQIPERLVIAEPIDRDGLELEGARLVPLRMGRSDTESTTSLHVPSVGLVVPEMWSTPGSTPISRRQRLRAGRSGAPRWTGSPVRASRSAAPAPS